jgi:hypothetical protein
MRVGGLVRGPLGFNEKISSEIGIQEKLKKVTEAVFGFWYAV